MESRQTDDTRRGTQVKTIAEQLVDMTKLAVENGEARVLATAAVLARDDEICRLKAVIENLRLQVKATKAK